MERADDIIKSLCRPVLVVALLAGLLLGCDRAPRKSKAGKEDGKELKEETAVKGEINIGIDITMEPVLKQVLDAYANKDVQSAINVWNSDDNIDAHYNSLFRELLTYMIEDPRMISSCAHLLFIAKNLERIGDHGTNIAEYIHFMVTGEEIATQRPRADVESSD